MKFISFIIISIMIARSDNSSTNSEKSTSGSDQDTLHIEKGFSKVNGINMYYEVHGDGKPIVLIHGGGSTIESCFSQLIPVLAQHRKVIALELQAHGRTEDRSSPSSFEQDADDVYGLLSNLKISSADIFGFSNGGTTALHLCMRHPESVDRLIIASALAKRDGVPTQFWEFMKAATLENMPAALKESFEKVKGDTNGLQSMHDRDAKRMNEFRDISDEHLRSINKPTLIIVGDKDIITPEHALHLNRLIPKSRLAILPGAHGEYMGEITTLQADFKPDVLIGLIDNFLKQ